MDNDELLHEGPDDDEQFVNSWQAMSESVGKARFDTGRPGGNVDRSASIYVGRRARLRATDVDLGAGG